MKLSKGTHPPIINKGIFFEMTYKDPLKLFKGAPLSIIVYKDNIH